MQILKDYAGKYEIFTVVDENEWDKVAEVLPTYIAYPSLGNAFIFAMDADLEEHPEIAEAVLSNVECWDIYSQE